MKRISIIITICSLSCPSLFSQEMLSLEQCRAMALKYNKEMAASIRQTESALSVSYTHLTLPTNSRV